jgi:hypothetical protein
VSSAGEERGKIVSFGDHIADGGAGRGDLIRRRIV